mgnify:FL=1
MSRIKTQDADWECDEREEGFQKTSLQVIGIPLWSQKSVSNLPSHLWRKGCSPLLAVPSRASRHPPAEYVGAGRSREAPAVASRRKARVPQIAQIKTEDADWACDEQQDGFHAEYPSWLPGWG